MPRAGFLVVTSLAAVLVPGSNVISGFSQAAAPAPARTASAKQVVGMWQLVSIVHDDGSQPPNRGARPVGLIAYDASGHMAVQIMPDRARPHYSGREPTPAEAKDAILGYTAYFGTYTIDERAKTVTHHRQGSVNPGDVKTDLVRRYEFIGDNRLVLTPVENPIRHLTWERVR